MERTYKVPASTYFGLGLFAAGLASVCLLVPCIFAYPARPLSQIVLLSVLAAAIPSATFWWFSRFRITITPTALRYASPFRDERTINLPDIESSEVIFQRGTRGVRPLLEVRTPGVTLRIHFKVFSREARKDLFQVTGANKSLQATAAARSVLTET
jgi:hypothetical protein